MLIVQFPSSLHDVALEALTGPFARAQYDLMVETGLSNWVITRGKENSYGNLPNTGKFIADASFDVRGQSFFHIEIAFSQTWDNLHAKINRILEDKSVLGVLAMNIEESGKFCSPKNKSKSNDFILPNNWFKLAITSQEGDPFRRILVNGHIWMGDMNIDLRLCKRPQEGAGGDPKVVCFPHQTPMITANSLL